MSRLGDVVKNVLLGILCVSCYILACGVLVGWNTFKCMWQCEKCGEKFKISFWQNIKSLTKGKLYHRLLYCPKCEQKTWCKGILE